MKNKLISIGTILILFMPILFNSCSNKTKLIGEWYSIEDNNWQVENSIGIMAYAEYINNEKDIISDFLERGGKNFHMKLTNKNKLLIQYSNEKETYGGLTWREGSNNEKILDYEIDRANLNIIYKYEGRDGNNYTRNSKYEIKTVGDTLELKLIIDENKIEELRYKFGVTKEELKIEEQEMSGDAYWIRTRAANTGWSEEEIKETKRQIIKGLLNVKPYKFLKIEDN